MGLFYTAPEPTRGASFRSRLVVLEKRPLSGVVVAVSGCRCIRHYYAPVLRVGGDFGIARSVRLSVPRRSCLGNRHAGCLQLSHRQPPEMCGLRSRPWTDVDPPQFLDPWTDADLCL